MTKTGFILGLAAPALLGCGFIGLATRTPTATATFTVPSSTLAPTETPTVTPTAEPSLTPTPTWVVQGPGHVLAPILMYHHVEVSPIDSPLRVSASRFEDEMRLLRQWEYTAITTTSLVQAIRGGTTLPPRPVIITFDDANEDTYTTAFPIMQKYGLTGVLFLPYTYVGAPGYLTVDEIKEMMAAGWEVGSHSLTHPNLTILGDAKLRAEIVDSRKRLQALLGDPILTFAYPFGDVSAAAVDYVRFAGYIAAMDAKGFTADQGEGNIFALQREEIRGAEDAKTFIRFLPWHGDPAFLPTDTATPTRRPTRTPLPTYTQYPTRTSPPPTP